MKLNRKIATVLLGLTLCFSLAAAAQKVINFGGLPKTGVLLPIPNGYRSMNWGNLDYITEELADGTRNVAVPWFTSTAETMSAADPNQPFHVLGMAVVGLANTTLTLHATTMRSYLGRSAIRCRRS